MHEGAVAWVATLSGPLLAYEQRFKAPWLARPRPVGHHPGDNTAGHFICVALSPSSFVRSLHCFLGRKVWSARSRHARCWQSGSCFIFSHDFFQTFHVYIFLAVALVWQVLRTMDSLRRQYTEDHWVIFFLDI